MRFATFVACFLAFPAFAYIGLDEPVAERLWEKIENGQLAVISDPDGFVNLRSAPDAGARIVLRIKRDEFFICEPSAENWWSACDFIGNSGFVHRSRVRLVKELPDADLDRLLINPANFEDEVAGRKELEDLRLGGAVKVGDLQVTGGMECLYANAARNQYLFLSYGTDGLLFTTLIFNGNPPTAVLNRIEVRQKDDRYYAAERDIRRVWKDFASACAQIPEKHFRTLKGLKPGGSMTSMRTIFGEPHRERTVGDVIVSEWSFPGKAYYEMKFLSSEIVISDQRRGEIYRRISQGHKAALNAEEWKRLRSLLREDNGAVLKELSRDALVGTKGSCVTDGFGFCVRAYHQNGKIVALEYNESTI